jgi:hypothetical protein
MSRGLGRIERAILELIEDGDVCEDRYATRDLALAIYQPERPTRLPTQAERVAVLRAMRSLARKYPSKLELTGGKGAKPLWLERR